MSQDNIAKIRQKIDEADQLIIKSIAIRQSLIEQIAKYKDPDNIQDPNREKEILENINTWSRKEKLDPNFVSEIYKQIMSEDLKKLKNILKK